MKIKAYSKNLVPLNQFYLGPIKKFLVLEKSKYKKNFASIKLKIIIHWIIFLFKLMYTKNF